MKKRIAYALAGAGALLMASMPVAHAGGHHRSDHHGGGIGGGEGGGKHGAQRTLLISIDGMHALDFQNCANGISTINGGATYCPNLAALAKTGVNYLTASTSKPSDSFPGLTAIISGASPRTAGANYDVAYDRALNPPQNDTGNGLLGTGPAPTGCTPGATPVGTSTEYEEGIDFDQSYLNGGAPSGDGGVNSIDPTRLERDKNCNPVYPWNFVRVNSIFGVIHAGGGYTAWSDKHPAYSSVSGPTGTSSASNLDDFYGPEINSSSANYLDPTKGAFPALIPAGCNPLPDQNTAGDDYTTSFQNIQCYDGLKVNAILNEIDGKNHDGTAKTQVPTIFGMNFQAVSVGQKLIYQYGAVPAGYSVKGGYLDSIGTPSPSLLKEIEFVDNSIGRMVTELTNQGLLDSTLIIITAKHGQSPIDSSRYVKNGSPNDPASLLSACIPDSELNQIGPTEDDVALLWLTPTSACSVSSQVALLESVSPANPVSANIAGIGEIFSGPALNAFYNPGDSRAPDILITPNIGVTYSNSKKKQAEHGGFLHDDTNVMLLASRPCLPSRTVYAAVETAQVAPTILQRMGYDPNALQGVQIEKTRVLPGLPKCSDGESD